MAAKLLQPSKLLRAANFSFQPACLMMLSSLTQQARQTSTTAVSLDPLAVAEQTGSLPLSCASCRAFVVNRSESVPKGPQPKLKLFCHKFSARAASYHASLVCWVHGCASTTRGFLASSCFQAQHDDTATLEESTLGSLRLVLVPSFHHCAFRAPI